MAFGSLVLGAYGPDGLEYVGNVGTGFDENEIDRLLKKLRPLERKTSPFASVPKMPRVKKGDVVLGRAEARRRGLVRRVDARRPPPRAGLPGTAGGQGPAGGPARAPGEIPERIPDVIGKGKRVLRLSNLDKEFWPDEHITKGDLLTYYRDVAEVVIPHIRNRPFTMKRYPDGWQGKFFFQKDKPAGMPDWIPTVSIEVTTRDRPRQRRRIDAPLVERRARAPLDGEHGLHRPEHVVLAGRQARPARLRALRPRPVARRGLPRDGPGRACS